MINAIGQFGIGIGTWFLIIGNSIGSFGAGELYLISSKMPYLFRNEKEYYEDDKKSEAVDFIVVKFQ